MEEEVLGLLENLEEIELDREKIKNRIEKPTDNELGDFSLPCFFLAKNLKKDPKKIAEDLKDKLEKEIKGNDKISEVKSLNGYLNFFVDKKEYIKEVLGKNMGGRKKNKGKVIVDFSSPNVGKPLHIGHIRSTILGDSLIKIMDWLGWNTHGINYINDEGLHIGKLIKAFQLWGDEEKIKKNPQKELLNLYVKYCKKEKLNSEEEIKKSPLQEDNEEIENKWAEEAKETLRKLEDGDKELREIWKKMKKYSFQGFNETYEELDVSFDEMVGSGKFSNRGKEIVNKMLDDGKAYEAENGAIIAKLEDDDLPDKVILRNDGTALYSTQDIGSAIERYNEHEFDRMIYVVGEEQKLYFKQLFRIFKKIGYDWWDKLKHLPFGLLKLEKGKISSREGNVVFLQDIIERAKKEALKEIKKKSPELDNKEEVAHKVGLAALKYSTLSKEPIKNILFSFDESVSFEGDTGPYLQYSHARACSIVREIKNEENGKDNEEGRNIKYIDSIDNFSDEEINLIKRIDQFEENVKMAGENLNPAILANYSYSLAKIFNEFYHKCKVIGSDKEKFRLDLVKKFKETLKRCLKMLGIEPLEEM